MTTSDNKLEQILERINNKPLPPVHLWQPELTGEMEMRIAHDGVWHYKGSPIQRQRMVKLFASILRYEQGHHYLVTPVEKYLITVDDAPFVALQVDMLEQHTPALLFCTNLGDEVIADADHQIWVTIDNQTEQPRPYLHVRDNLNALIHRNAFYQLVEWSQQRCNDGCHELVISSGGQTFVLGQL